MAVKTVETVEQKGTEILNTFTTADALRIAAKKAGVKASRLDEAIQAYSLPKSGTFGTPYLVQNHKEPDMSHIAIKVDGSMHVISMGRIQGMGFVGTQEEAESKITESSRTPGTYILSGNTTFNPDLSGDQATRGFELKGKRFKAEEIDAKVLKFVVGGIDNEDEAKKSIVAKKFYKVTVL